MNRGTDPLTVLIIDDEEGIRRSSKRIIDDMGCRTLIAGNGSTGLGILQTESVDIALLGIASANRDGMEALSRIVESYPDTLVIVLCGSATIETAIEAMKNGAYDVIPKQHQPDQLQMAVNRAREKILLTHEAQRQKPTKLPTLVDLGTEQSRIHTIVDTLPIGLLVTDAQGRVVLTNPMFRRQMQIPETLDLGQPVQRYIQDDGLCRLILDISQGCRAELDDIPDYEFSPGSDTFLMAHGRPVIGDDQECQGAVVTFEDISAQKVIDRLKSEFIANVSHELRSPLSTIHEQLAAVLSNMVGQAPSNEEHLISRAKEKTQGLISLIGDLLDLSRIESGAVCEEPKQVALEELMANIIDFLGPQAAAKGQSLTLLQPSQPLPAIKADPLALESIFGNLITNAIAYTHEKGSIEVRMSRAGSHLQVQVVDNGFGMERRHLERIFDRFYRVKTEKTRYITGTGLGLPIVRGLVDTMGGTVHAESAPGEGSTFTVLLPGDLVPPG